MSFHQQDSVLVNLKWCDPEQAGDLSLPAYKTPGSAGLDVAAAIQSEVTIKPKEIVLIPTGFAVEIPQGYEIQVRPRSGLAIRHGVTIVNAPGTIDADYRGEVMIGLINLGNHPHTIFRGDRIAQLVVSPVVRIRLNTVATLTNTERGDGGFGHTGLK